MDKKIYIYAYTHMNLGDDLFVKLLCERYPETRFYINCNIRHWRAFKDIPNLVVIPNIRYVDGLLKRLNIKWSINSNLSSFVSYFCDASVNIGGSIFMQDENWKLTIKYYKKRIVKNKPFYIIGSNFGPYNEDIFYKSYKAIFKNVADICFRDIYSHKAFYDLQNSRHAADVVFLLQSEKQCKSKKQIIISVIDLSKRNDLLKYEKNYKEKIIESSRYFIKKGYSVILMGFCESEGDKKAIEDILACIDDEEKKSIIPYYYLGDISGALKLIQESQYVLASRFHAMILGWVFHKPVYPIVYSEKSLHVMEDCGFDGEYSTIKSINKTKVNKIFEYLSNSEPLNIEEQTYSANLQFKMLDEFIIGERKND